MNGTPLDPLTEHLLKSLDQLEEFIGIKSPFPWCPPGGLSEESDDEEATDSGKSSQVALLPVSVSRGPPSFGKSAQVDERMSFLA